MKIHISRKYQLKKSLDEVDLMIKFEANPEGK